MASDSSSCSVMLSMGLVGTGVLWISWDLVIGTYFRSEEGEETSGRGWRMEWEGWGWRPRGSYKRWDIVVVVDTNSPPLLPFSPFPIPPSSFFLITTTPFPLTYSLLPLYDLLFTILPPFPSYSKSYSYSSSPSPLLLDWFKVLALLFLVD